jgi:hypothetical protein
MISIYIRLHQVGILLPICMDLRLGVPKTETA